MLVAFSPRHRRRMETCVINGFCPRMAAPGPFGDWMAQEKILIVDDEVVVAEDIRRQLGSLGYTVIGAVSSGSEAVHVAGEQRPDLILMDVKLKGPIDGIDAARTIHAQYGIPVIYLTAFSDEDTLARARQTLPLAYLIKPFVSSDLRAALELALFRHRVSRIAEQRGRWLDAVVQSMGEAVVTVDLLGRVTLLNPAAERLTGWPQSDALGKAIQDVMIMLDPQQRTPVSHPALHALGTRPLPQLSARPLLLVDRRGGERLICDSTAVIQDERGTASGVVLVFRLAANA